MPFVVEGYKLPRCHILGMKPSTSDPTHSTFDQPRSKYNQAQNYLSKQQLTITMTTLCLKKNIPNVFSYNSRKH